MPLTMQIPTIDCCSIHAQQWNSISSSESFFWPRAPFTRWMDGCERTTHSHSSTSSPRDIPIEFNRFDCQQKRRNGPRSYFQLIWLAPFVPPSVLLTIQGFRIIIMQRLIGTRRHMVSRKSFANHSPPVLTLSPDTTFLTRRPLEHADSPHVQPFQGSMACSS